jgi:hypothetical protein
MLFRAGAVEYAALVWLGTVVTSKRLGQAEDEQCSMLFGSTCSGACCTAGCMLVDSYLSKRTLLAHVLAACLLGQAN